MAKQVPAVFGVTEDVARPFIAEHCKEFNIPFEYNAELPFGQAVLWLGASTGDEVEAVAGMFVSVDRPDELYVYGIYGHNKRCLLALVKIFEDLPYHKAWGHVHKNNKKMLNVWSKYSPEVLELDENLLIVRGSFKNGRQIKSGSKRGAECASKSN